MRRVFRTLPEGTGLFVGLCDHDDGVNCRKCYSCTRCPSELPVRKSMKQEHNDWHDAVNDRIESFLEARRRRRRFIG